MFVRYSDDTGFSNEVVKIS